MFIPNHSSKTDLSKADTQFPVAVVFEIAQHHYFPSTYSGSPPSFGRGAFFNFQAEKEVSESRS
ncbi:MAG: hypothetical protein IT258_09530 [Saprospiraceae bacterium]|nr:hypothetical protein [Saprospiraceae bacterium]